MTALELSPRDIDRFRLVVSSRLGLRFDEGKRGFLGEILGRRSAATGQRPEAYLAHLESTPARDEVRLLAAALTVTETYFFRSADQLRAFSDIVLRDATRAQPQPAGRRRLRVLSAACSSGDEAYSLAIVLRDLPQAAGWDISIRAIDVNPAMLERAARGRYSGWAMRETPAEVSAHYFRSEGRGVILDARIRSMVAFEERNLVDDDPGFWQPGAFDVIFCRNVIMYFTPEAQRAVIARLTRSLAPGGFLFLGHAETLRGLSEDFHLLHTHGTFYYQRREQPAAFAQPDASWVEIIRRASERIDTLSTPQALPPDTALPGGRLSDLGPIVALMSEERYPEAEELLSALPSQAAGDADVLLLRAVLLTHGGDLVAAETLCAQVIERDPTSAGAHYLAALCRENAGDRPGAVDHDQAATTLDPGFAMARMHLGLLSRRSGDHGAARRELGDALELLRREDASRLLLFGGGFSRSALMTLCRAELLSCGGTS